LRGEPQHITRRGRQVVVVVSHFCSCLN
jgi:hypothetical protein